MEQRQIEREELAIGERQGGLADEALLASSTEDPRLFEVLVARYQEPFLRAAMRIVKRREDAEDIVQEAFLRIYKNAHRFVKREEIEFKSWAYRIVLNTSFTHYQRLKKHGMRKEPQGEEILINLSSGKNEGEEREMRLTIESILAEMPGDLAAILRKHYLEDKAYEVIASEDGATIAAIKMKLYRGRQAFKKLFLAGEGST